jgi:hypothetical protein
VTSALLVLAVLTSPALASAELAEAPPPPPCYGTTPVGSRVCAGLDAAGRGHWAEAEALLESARLLEDPILALHAAEIDAALASARAHLGSLDVHCAPRGASIAVDGLERDIDPIERPLRLTLGAHTVRCSLANHEPAEGAVTIEAGTITSLSLSLTPIDRRPVLERIGSPGEAQRIVGITALALGGVSVAVGVGTLVAGLESRAADRESYFDVARGTLIAGGVLVVAGLVLVLTAE